MTQMSEFPRQLDVPDNRHLRGTEPGASEGGSDALGRTPIDRRERPPAGQTTGHPEQSTSAIVVPHPEAKYFIA
jgi:hypothetical protein